MNASRCFRTVRAHFFPPRLPLLACLSLRSTQFLPPPLLKSQIQALDRMQPGLPLKKGRVATMTHDYKRNGTTTLFAALNVETGEVVGQCLPRHRAKDFIKLLNKIDTAVTRSMMCTSSSTTTACIRPRRCGIG
jgi:hypothetical protein